MAWSTKDRVRIIPPDFAPQLYGYISGIITNNAGRMLIAGGDADHIHVLVSIGRIDTSELIDDIKRDSSSWIKQQQARFAQFYWQRGYRAFSIGQSQVEAVTKYIRDQREHHKSQSYKDEFRALDAKYEIDERFCWN